MHTFFSFKNLFIQSITISFTRVVLLITPILYVFIISNYDNSNLEYYTLSTQFTQIELIILVSLNIGTNIIFSKNKGNEKFYSYCLGGLLYISILLSVFFVIISFCIFEGLVNYLNIVMLLSMPLSALYLVSTSILESNGKEKTAFNISLLALMLNIILLALILIFFRHNITNWIIIVAVLTKVFTLCCSSISIKKHLNYYIKSKINKSVLKEMLSYGIPEASTSLVFTLSIFVSLYILYYWLNLNISIIGISLNYKNIISMFFVSYCIAYTINHSKSPKIKLTQDILMPLTIFYTTCVLVMILSLPLFSFLYHFDEWYLVMSYLILSVFIVCMDAIELFIVFHLRINGFKKYPPLLRLSFAFIGVPIGLFLARANNRDYYYLVGLLIGNALFALLAIFIYIKLSVK